MWKIMIHYCLTYCFYFTSVSSGSSNLRFTDSKQRFMNKPIWYFWFGTSVYEVLNMLKLNMQDEMTWTILRKKNKKGLTSTWILMKWPNLCLRDDQIFWWNDLTHVCIQYQYDYEYVIFVRNQHCQIWLMK